MVSVNNLQFYIDNPRVYSVVRAEGGAEPDQDRIQEVLEGMDHVKRLIHSIKNNGGLTDPLLVRKEDMAVLEGNSRLAAYRSLIRKDPIKWKDVKCDVVQGTITNNDVRALLASYHIIGRKDWDPFEQAGMFYRWNQEGEGIDTISVAVEGMGINSGKIKHWIEVYTLMVNENDTQSHRWSYYDDLLKSSYIKAADQKEPRFIATVISEIKNGSIKKADDIRTKVVAVAKAGGKVVKHFVKSKNLDQAYDSAVAGGAENVLHNQLKKFRKIISRPEACKNVKRMNKTTIDGCIYELKKIKIQVQHLLEAIEKESNM